MIKKMKYGDKINKNNGDMKDIKTKNTMKIKKKINKK